MVGRIRREEPSVHRSVRSQSGGHVVRRRPPHEQRRALLPQVLRGRPLAHWAWRRLDARVAGSRLRPRFHRRRPLTAGRRPGPAGAAPLRKRHLTDHPRRNAPLNELHAPSRLLDGLLELAHDRVGDGLHLVHVSHVVGHLGLQLIPRVRVRLPTAGVTGVPSAVLVSHDDPPLR